MNLLIWGIGNYTKNVLSEWKEEIDKLCNIIGFIDNDIKKKGFVDIYCKNLPVYMPDEITRLDCDAIVIISTYEDLIREQIKNSGGYLETLIYGIHLICYHLFYKMRINLLYLKRLYYVVMEKEQMHLCMNCHGVLR